MSMLADAYKKALDYIHSALAPIGSKPDPDDPLGLKRTTGGGAQPDDVIVDAGGKTTPTTTPTPPSK